ncbi:MAG TPA: hypothetical protein VJ925_01265 [Longimicrobiales bacterium]|nr:hypothetical protein [Longimicrobiales bacterium]
MSDLSASDSTSRLGRALAALGVIGSLVFVGLEIQQNTAAIRAQTRQGVADRNADAIYAVAENPELARAWTIVWQDGIPGEVATPVDSAQARWAMWGMVRMVEHAYLQVEEGILPESSLNGYGFRDNNNFQNPQFAPFWADIRNRFDPRFVEAFEAEYGF